MMIEIQCGNFSDFDAALGRYVECGEKLIVSGDQVGQIVLCPKCKQQIEVPIGTEIRQESSPAEKRAAKIAAKKPGPASIRNPAKIPQSDPPQRASIPQTVPQKKKLPDSELTGKPAGKRSPGKKSASRVASKSDKSNRNPSATKPSGTISQSTTRRGSAHKKNRGSSSDPQKADVMSIDFRDQAVSSTLSEDRIERCKKCGNIVENGQCTVCKFVEPKFEKLHQSLNEIEIEITGFQRWFIKTMNEGVSIKVLEYVTHAMLGLLGVFVLFAAIIGFLGLGVGRIGGFIMLIAVCSAAMLYVGLIYKGHQFTSNPQARLAWFQKPFWNLLLRLARTMNWQNYDSRLKNRKIITVRESFFRDDEIMELEGIKNCQVLDLQGTSVTDRGLLHLYGLRHLQCVVLKRTNVTHEGVFRLQQSFPRLWIWY